MCVSTQLEKGVFLDDSGLEQTQSLGSCSFPQSEGRFDGDVVRRGRVFRWEFFVEA